MGGVMNRFRITKDLCMINAFAGVLFILLVATIAHLLFSHLGLNPTDDGWVLAGSRRIIEGQIPHRDFISFHVTGSLFLHAPFVLLGGDYVFLISRYFVWIQFASIAWAWTIVIARSFKVFSTLLEKFAVALIAFSFSAHYFPIMAWYTIDGLFFVSLGIMLCDNEFKWAKMVGYALIGIAPLCKQVFLPMIPITLLLSKDWRQLFFWIVTTLPIAVFGVYLAIFGAIPDAFLQLTTHRDFFSVGLSLYVTTLSFPLGIVGGSLAAYMIYNTFNSKHQVNIFVLQRLIGILMIFGLIFGAAWALFDGRFNIITTFGIFGADIGVTSYFVFREQKLTSYSCSGLLIVFVTYCITISLGYGRPALMAGTLILFLMASVQFSCQLTNKQNRFLNKSKCSHIRWFSTKNSQMLINFLIIFSVVSSLVAFGIARQNYIYREQPASHLTYDLGDVLPGAEGIKTNENTYNFFVDLRNAKNIVKERGKKYCIVPDTAVNWVKDPQSNPLPCDWSNNYVLGRKEVIDRVIGDLDEIRSEIIVIVQKYKAETLAGGGTPVSDEYVIVNYVRSNYDKIGETQYFELYE